jgi:hypothetical protein
MANSLTALNKEMWDAELQEELEKKLVALKTCQTTIGDEGDTINKPYRSRHLGQAYSKGTDFSVQDLTVTNEQLSINKVECVPVYIDKVDEVQNSWDARNEYTPDFVQDLLRRIDGNILAEYDNADQDIDDGDIGGTSGNNITVASSNVHKVIGAAKRKLRNKFVEGNLFMTVGPSFAEQLEILFGLKDTGKGDDVLQNGFMGFFFGMEIYVSTNLTYTATWTPANNPTNAGTITINGVTITFVSALSGGDGEVLIGGATANTIDNLVSLLNDPLNTASSANYAAFSVSDAALLDGMVATDGTTYLGIEHISGGEVTLATSDSNDPWSAQVLHALAGQKGATRLALQRTPQVGFNQEPKRLPGSGNLVVWDIYGFKTWQRNTEKLVDINIDASGF